MADEYDDPMPADKPYRRHWHFPFWTIQRLLMLMIIAAALYTMILGDIWLEAHI